MTSSGALGVGIFLAVIASAAPARAAEEADPSAPTEEQRSEAKARYEAGVAAYTAGHYKDAVDLFLAADKLAPSSPLSFNIARAYEKLGDDSGSLRFYRDYLRRTPSAANAADVGALVKRFEERLRAKGVQQMTVLSTPTGATVALDGAPVGVTPATLDMPPGTHHVALMLRGYADTERDIDLPADHALDVSLELAPAPEPNQTGPVAASPVAAPPPAPTAPAHDESRGLGIWPYVTLGAGAAALAGALTFELMRSSSEKSAKDASTQVEYKDHYDTMVSQRTTARVFLGVGGALVVTGGVLLAIDLAKASPNKKAAWLGIAPTAGGVTGSLAGSF